VATIRPSPPEPHDGGRLFQRLVALPMLSAGWEKVRGNGGASGGDRVTCDAFGIGSDMRIAELSRELISGAYHPGPLRFVDIAKPSGGTRRLSIPCVRDRVAQSAAAQLLSPLFEAEFEDVSFGYRPGRSVKQALARVQTYREEGWRFTVDADIEAYFDNVPHDRLMTRLMKSVSDSPLTELVSLWLETSAVGGRGLAQGSPLFPLLANLYLDELDEALLKTPVRLVRFADDFVVLTRSEADAAKALDKVRLLLESAGLRLHPEKTRVRSFDDSLKYLGAVFIRSMVLGDTIDEGFGNVDRLLADIARQDAERDAAKTRIVENELEEKAAGYDRGVRTLYLNTPKRELGLKNLAFAVRDPRPEAEKAESRADARERLLVAIHPSRIDRIEIGPESSATTDALRHALSYGIEVAFVNGHGETEGNLTGPLPPRARRHLAQARHVLDPDLRLSLARLITAARLRNQRALLRRLNQRRGLDQVAQICAQYQRPLHAAENARDLDHLMGIEGAATAKYWRGWSALLMHGWAMPARKRRPAPDAANIALNVACNLLERDIRTVLLARGLHPGFGVLHGIDDAHEALVYDMMEIFRSALVESVVLEAFNTRMLRPEHFRDFDGVMRLGNSGYAAIVRAYEERAEGLVKSPRNDNRVTWRRLILEQAEDLAAYFEGSREFSPYVMNY
jgi:CRISPR-associated protein Cas1